MHPGGVTVSGGGGPCWVVVLVCFVATTLVHSSSTDNSQHEHHDHLLCRHCGAELTENDYANFINVTSPQSQATHHLPVLGHSQHLLVQTLRNPADVTFDLVSVRRSGCSGVGDWFDEHTWFPGYSWRVCVCPRCLIHLGWIFEPKEKAGQNHFRASPEGFYGLILDKLITETFSDSLVIGLWGQPKQQQHQQQQ